MCYFYSADIRMCRLHLVPVDRRVIFPNSKRSKSFHFHLGDCVIEQQRQEMPMANSCKIPRILTSSTAGLVLK